MPIPKTTALGGLLILVAGATLAQQGAPAPGVTRRETQLENPQVRVWKTVIAPRQPLSFHRHDHNRVLIALTEGTLRVVDPSGKELTTYRWERGKSYWLPADPAGQTHADVNDSDRPIEVIVVELQSP